VKEPALSPEAMVTSGRRYGYAAFDRSGNPTWTELRPEEGGRVVVMRARPDGTSEPLVPQGLNARSRVHEYGGRPHTIEGENIVIKSTDLETGKYRFE
jgi:hypothetical protein